MLELFKCSDHPLRLFFQWPLFDVIQWNSLRMKAPFTNSWLPWHGNYHDTFPLSHLITLLYFLYNGNSIVRLLDSPLLLKVNNASMRHWKRIFVFSFIILHLLFAMAFWSLLQTVSPCTHLGRTSPWVGSLFMFPSVSWFYHLLLFITDITVFSRQWRKQLANCLYSQNRKPFSN